MTMKRKILEIEIVCMAVLLCGKKKEMIVVYKVPLHYRD